MSLGLNSNSRNASRFGNAQSRPSSIINFSSPNSLVARRTLANQYAGVRSVLNPGIGFAPQTRAINGFGPFRNNVQTNLSAVNLPNSFNLARSGINYDYYDPLYPNQLDPRLYAGPVYANGYPFPYAYGRTGPLPTNQLDPRVNNLLAYQNGYPVPPQFDPNPTLAQSYPLTSPECSPYMECSSYADPNDCRSCVSAAGGSSHCADQICGPHNPYP